MMNATSIPNSRVRLSWFLSQRYRERKVEQWRDWDSITWRWMWSNHRLGYLLTLTDWIRLCLLQCFTFDFCLKSYMMRMRYLDSLTMQKILELGPFITSWAFVVRFPLLITNFKLYPVINKFALIWHCSETFPIAVVMMRERVGKFEMPLPDVSPKARLLELESTNSV